VECTHDGGAGGASQSWNMARGQEWQSHKVAGTWVAEDSREPLSSSEATNFSIEGKSAPILLKSLLCWVSVIYIPTESSLI
jgi:hypothetical protein